MDFGKAFTFVLDDKDWMSKLLIGGLVTLIPVIGSLILLGWSLEIGRRVIQGESEVLPSWDDFGTYTMRGLKAFVVSMVYSLPLILLLMCPLFLPLVAGNGQNSDAMGGIFGGLIMLSWCLVIIYTLIMAFVMPAALMRFTMHDDSIAAGLAFGEVFGMVTGHIGTYALTFLGILVAGFIGSLGSIACGIGLLFTLPYAYAVNGHLYGQSYADATGGGFAPTIGQEPPAAADWTG